MASSGDRGPVEVLVLGPPIVRVGGAAPLRLTRALAKTVILLAARGGPVGLGEFTKELAVGKDSVHQNISKLRKLDIPIAQTGRGDTGEYHLEPAGCRIDAQEFARGADGEDIGAMLSLWRGPLPEFPQFLPKGLDAPWWATVKAARSRIIQRISELSEAERRRLAELPRFAGLFPGDQEVNRIRLHAPDAKPRLLVVEDDPDMMRQICRRLDSNYKITPLRGIDEWFDYRDHQAGQLALIQGALIDLSLTSKLNDKEGLEIVTHLRDKTGVAVALVTANSLESTEFDKLERMALYRLVDIVNKQSDDWYSALERTTRRLVGTGVQERRRRMETWLNAAHQKVMMETSDSDPDSVQGRLRHTRHVEWASLLGRVQVEDVDEVAKEVTRYCVACGASNEAPPPFAGPRPLPVPGLPVPQGGGRRRGQRQRDPYPRAAKCALARHDLQASPVLAEPAVRGAQPGSAPVPGGALLARR